MRDENGQNIISIMSGDEEVLRVDALMYAGPSLGNADQPGLNLEAAGVKLKNGFICGPNGDYTAAHCEFRSNVDNISGAGTCFHLTLYPTRLYRSLLICRLLTGIGQAK